jgi:hypothetical protein
MATATKKTTKEDSEADAATARQRVQLDFSPEAFARLQEIKDRSEAKTNAEVVRNALRVYDWFLRQREAEYKFHLVKGDLVKEVELVL